MNRSVLINSVLAMNTSCCDEEFNFNATANQSEIVTSSLVDTLIGVATAMILAIMILATAIGKCVFY